MASIGMIELLVLGFICLIPIALALLALLVVLVVVLVRNTDRQREPGDNHTQSQGDVNG